MKNYTELSAGKYQLLVGREKRTANRHIKYAVYKNTPTHIVVSLALCLLQHDKSAVNVLLPRPVGRAKPWLRICVHF